MKSGHEGGEELPRKQRADREDAKGTPVKYVREVWTFSPRFTDLHILIYKIQGGYETSDLDSRHYISTRFCGSKTSAIN